VRTKATAVLAVAGVVVLGLVAYAGWRTVNPKLPPLHLPDVPGCVVKAAGEVSLDPEQMANAATIAAVGVRLKVPARAVVVALATALQESKLRNLPGGDRDSIGLFQQRPSQDWGTAEQVAEPRYAAKAFYGALLQVPGWETMRVTDAAQAVQHSGAPQAYERWADNAAVLARALLGDAAGAVACTIADEPTQRGAPAVQAVVTGLKADWGKVTTATQGLGVAITAANQRAGWQYAHWLVAHAEAHGVMRVAYAGQEWTAKSGNWTVVASPGPSAKKPTAQVQAEVYPAL
jgi:hypothetical protein